MVRNDIKLPEKILLGYQYVPIQIAEERNLYSAENGLERGTIFPRLDLPLGVYGRQKGDKEEMK